MKKIQTVGMRSFYGCKQLSFINLSTCSKLTDIGWWAFRNCKNVSEILLPRGLLKIEIGAFSYNILVTNITIPVSVRSIDSLAFKGCSNLEHVFFEEESNLKSIGDSSFVGTAITSFQILENVETINGAAFNYEKLTNITIHPKNEHLIIENHCIYSSNRKTLFAIFNKSIESFDVPNYVTTLGESCFSGKSITSITIPDSVTKFGYCCFEYLNITTIELPDSIKEISYSCFQSSTLTTITIPESVTSIEDRAFYNCRNLKNVTILGPISNFGISIFPGCYYLELVNFPNFPTCVNSISIFGSSKLSKLTIYFTCKTLFSAEAFDYAIKVKIEYFLNVSHRYGFFFGGELASPQKKKKP